MELQFLTEIAIDSDQKSPDPYLGVKAIVDCCGEYAKTADGHVASVPALPCVQLGRVRIAISALAGLRW
jgi:hypothetical protein